MAISGMVGGVVVACCAGIAAAQGPESTAPVMRRAGVAPNTPVLVKSIGDAAELLAQWRPPEDASLWQARKAIVRRALLRSLGLDPLPPRTPLRARTVAADDRGLFVVENVAFESRRDFPVSANLYRPRWDGKARRPAVLLPIGHYLAEGKSASEVQALAIDLARRGIVVLTYDAIGHGDRMVPGNVHHEAGYALLPLGETIAGWMVWDSMRALDYLETLPDVDATRMAITGNSGGGLNSLLTAAIDERVRAAAVAGFTFEFRHWIKYAGSHCACTHLPGIFRSMEWFEIAGLIAPRALLLLQGERDELFPVVGARRAAGQLLRVYQVLRAEDGFRFDELAGQGHAYSKPFRERALGWLAKRLLAQGDGSPASEDEPSVLPEDDPRLSCVADPRMGHQASVVEMAKELAVERLADLREGQGKVADWIRGLVQLEEPPGFLAPAVLRRSSDGEAQVEEVTFLSEDGIAIPGTLWLPPSRTRPPVVVIADSRGRASAGRESIIRPLLESGYAALAVDLRGRGETLGSYGPGLDTNYRLVGSQVLLGRPLAGLRAFDLRRTLDYLGSRRDLAAERVAVVGFGDDALPAILAAAVDDRVDRLAVSGYFHSFVSQMAGMPPQADRKELRRVWNSAQAHGQVDAGPYVVDFGSVIPSGLEVADLPEIIAQIPSARVMFCGARDAHRGGPAVERLRSLMTRHARFVYRPETPLDGVMLREWLRSGAPSASSI